MNEILEKNLSLLAQYRPALRQRVEPYLNTIFPGELVVAANGRMNIRWRSVTGELVDMHPVADPEGACQECVGQLQGMEGQIIFFLGFGLGYEALAVCAEYSRLNQIKVLDPHPLFFVQSIKYMDLSSLIVNSNVELHIGVTLQDLEGIVSQADRWFLLKDEPYLLSLKSAVSTDPLFYESAVGRLQRLLHYQVSQTAVSISKAKPMLLNSFQNLSTMVEALPLDSLAGRFAGIPAILIAAGPSLKKNIKKLQARKECAVVIAVDSAVPCLLDNGISPHFVVTMDSQHRNADSFRNYWEMLANNALVYLNYATPFITKNYTTQRQYFLFDQAPVNQWFSKMLGGGTAMVDASTVSLLGLFTAHLLGCDPVIMVGVDLAHDVGENEVVADRAHFKTIGCTNQDVVTTAEFLNMLASIEMFLAQVGGRFINASEGLKIQHTQFMDINEALERFCRDEFYFPDLPSRHDVDHVIPRCVAFMDKTADDLRLLADECREIMAHANTAYECLVEMELLRKQQNNFAVMVPEILADSVNMARQKHIAVATNKYPPGNDGVASLLDSLLGSSRLESHRKKTLWAKQHPEIRPGVDTIAGLLGEMVTHKELCQDMIDKIHWCLARIDIARKRLGSFVSMDNDDALCSQEEYLAKGTIFLESMDIDEAERCFRSVLDNEPDHPAAHLGLGRVFLARRDSVNAMMHFHMAQAMDDTLSTEVEEIIAEVSSQYLLAGKDRIKRGRIGAGKFLEDILPEFPDYPEAQRYLAECPQEIVH